MIRAAVSRVAWLRQAAAETPGLAAALGAIKHVQSNRFAGTYLDLLQSEQHRPAVVFFLEELYGEKDYSKRDTQFSDMAGALEQLFPRQVVKTAVSLAQLHCLTEDLDLSMARSWMTFGNSSEVARYVAAWRVVARRSDRIAQLTTALEIGNELALLTRMRGLRLLLKTMRGPANLAGLASLQRFLESGFDAFAAMGRASSDSAYFLSTVQARESGFIEQLFDASADSCETAIALALRMSAAATAPMH